MDASRYGSELGERAEEQIAALRKEVRRLSEALSDRGGGFLDDAAESASRAYDEMRRSGAKAMRVAGRQASAASDLARDNPVASLAIVVGIGLLAMALLARRDEYR
ncbi:MAG: hypothetical protein AB7S41_19635 [Parvibaculaceae bacterium]